MRDDDLEEMIKQGIETRPSLVYDLLDLLCFTYNDFAEAAKWVAYAGVTGSKVPLPLRKYIGEEAESSFSETDTKKQGSGVSMDYLALPMPPSAVIMVDDEQKLVYALRQIQDAQVVGVDTEWQADFGQSIKR